MRGFDLRHATSSPASGRLGYAARAARLIPEEVPPFWTKPLNTPPIDAHMYRFYWQAHKA
ncbi:hypothetical protein M3J09_001451 [Ascochyta lentis]